MAKFFLWCILLILYWPLALLALIAYPVVWLLLLPFRLAGIAVDGVLQLVRGVVLLPGRLLRGPSRLLKNSAKWDRQIDPVVLRCSQH